MPNTHSTLTALFTDIANAIREKDGSTTQKVADAFPAAIRAIPSGGGTDVEDGILTGEISGEYTNSRITTLRLYAFYNCKYLTKVALPLCTSVASSAFYNCSNLSTITIPVCSIIGSYAFDFCGSLVAVSLPACTKIESYAFYNCKSLMSFYLTGSSVPALTNSNAFGNTPISNSTYLGYFGSIIVRSSLLSAFQAAKNWSRYSSRFSAWNEVD